MFITIINDSKDDNAKARQTTRWSALFPVTNISFVGIDSSLGVNATIEASGNLVDILDAGMNKPGIIAVNVAPRGHKHIDGENGSKFCYFWVGNILVVSTIKDYNLSLVKKLKLVRYLNVLDTKLVLEEANRQKLITKDLVDYISRTQFRSFDFQPRVAKWIFEGKKVPFEKISIDTIKDVPNTAWHIDSFGNIKLTLTKKDFLIKSPACKIKTNIGNFRYYKNLKDIPDGETAIYSGSSGWKNARFLELATQNRDKSAKGSLNIEIGTIIENGLFTASLGRRNKALRFREV